MHKPEILIYPELAPLGSPKKLVVFLHGVGSDGDDLISLASFFQNQFPDMHFISPHGIEPYDMAPYGRQWFSLGDRKLETLSKLAKESAQHVQQIIDTKQQALSLTNRDTVLIGFSQGAMLGTYMTLAQEQEAYGGLVAYSGLLLAPESIKNKETPICIIHGAEDEVIQSLEARRMQRFLGALGVEHEMMILPNLRHSIDMAGIRFASQFLLKHFNKEGLR